MLAYPLEEKRLLKWNTPTLLAQPKLDGERCRVLVDSPSIFLVSSEGNIITSCPHIESTLRDLRLPFGTELDGEIYSHNLTFSQIHSRVSRKTNIHTHHEELSLHIFDLVTAEDQLTRLQQLLTLIPPDLEHLRLVPTALMNNNLDELVDLMNLYTSEGYEGIILRHPDATYERKRSTSMLKFKPRATDTFRIIDTQEEISKDGTPKNTLGALICQAYDSTQVFGVGSGFTAEQRRDLWQIREDLPNNFVRIHYQQLSEKKVPRFPIFAELIFVNPITEGSTQND